MNPVSLKSGPWVRPYSDNVKMELELRWTGTPQRALSTVPAERTEVPEGCHLSTWYNCSWSKVRNHPIGLTSKALTLQEGHLTSESTKPPTKSNLPTLSQLYLWQVEVAFHDIMVGGTDQGHPQTQQQQLHLGRDDTTSVMLTESEFFPDSGSVPHDSAFIFLLGPFLSEQPHFSPPTPGTVCFHW